MLEYLIFKTAVCVAGLFYFQKAINDFDFKIKTKFQTVFEMVNIFLLFVLHIYVRQHPLVDYYKIKTVTNLEKC